MADRYGASSEGYKDVRARAKEQEQAYKDLEARDRAAQDAETRGAGARQKNVSTRSASVDAMQRQVTALDSVITRINAETAALERNTASWAASNAGRAGRYGQSTVGYQDTKALLAQGEAAAVADQRLQALARTQAQASRVASPTSLGAIAGAQSAQARISAAALRSDPRAAALLGTGAALDPWYAQQARIAQTQAAQAAARTLPVNARAQDVLMGASLGPWAQQGGAAPVREYTRAEQEAIATVEKAQASIGRQGQMLARSNVLWRESVAEMSAASQALTRHGALTSEFIQSLVRGQVTLREFGSQLTTTIGKFAGWAVAGGLVYGAFEALKHVVQGGTETATGVAQLERAGLPDFNRERAEQGFRELSANVNVPISEAASAQFYATRAGFRNMPESQSVAQTALMASKLDEVPIQDATRAFGALRAAFGLSSDQIRGVFNELDVGQLKFNSRLNQTLPMMGRAASAWANAGGTYQQLARQLVEVVGVTGGQGGSGGGNPATFFLREPTNIARPQSEQILRTYGFNPRTPIGTLNEEIQRAASHMGPQERRELATALGGPQLGQRYGLGVINSGPSGRAAEVEAGLSHSQGSAQNDLNSRLRQFNEQVSAIGNTLQRVGSEFGQIGFTKVAEDAVGAMRIVGYALEFVVKPFERLGSVLQSIPGAAQQALVLAGGAAAATRFSRSQSGVGLSRVLEEASGGLLGSPSAGNLRALRRTTSEGLTFVRGEVESSARDYLTQRSTQRAVLGARGRFIGENGNELANVDKTSARGVELAGRVAEYDEKIGKADTRANIARERLLAAHERQLELEQTEATLTDTRLSVRERVAGAVAQGQIAAPRGEATNLPLIGFAGPTGTAAEARAGGPLGYTARTASGRALQERLSTAEGGAAASMAAADAEVAAVMQAGAQENRVAAQSLAEAWAAAVAQVTRGGQEMGAAAADAAASILGGGFGGASGAATRARAGAGEAIGGAGIFAGALGSKIGQNALKGLTYAFIGSMAAEAIGGAVGGKAGSAISNVGSDVAIGAGIGAIIPGVGPLAGAGVGLAAGLLDQSGILGGGTAAEHSRSLRKKREDQLAKEGKAEFEQAISGNRAEFASELEASIKDESEAATKAKEKVSQRLKNLGAETDIFGPGTERGAEARSDIAEAIAKTYAQYYKAPRDQRAKAAQAYQEALSNGEKIAQKALQVELPFARTPEQRSQVLSNATKAIEDGYTKAGRSIITTGQELQQVQARKKLHEAALTREVNDLRKKEGFNIKEAKEASALQPEVEKDEQREFELIRRKKEEEEGRAGLSRQGDLAAIAAEETVFKAADQKRKSQLQLQLARTVEPSRRRALEAKARREEETEQQGLRTHGAAGEEAYQQKQDERDAKEAEEKRAAVKERAERLEVTGRQRITRIPRYEKQHRLDTEVRNAQEILDFERRNKGSFDWKEIADAQTKLDEAKQAARENIEAEARELVSARGALAKAQAFGNAQAQASIAGREAQELLALAHTPKERLDAQTKIQDAQNQAQQAAQAHISAEGELAEAHEREPLGKTRIKLQTERRLLAGATPDERLKVQAQIANEEERYTQEVVSEKGREIEFHRSMHQISTEAAISQYRSLLKLHNLSRREREDILLKIYTLQNELGVGDNKVFNAAPGSIKLPTAIDVRRAISAAAHGQGMIIHSPTENHSQVNQFNITIRDSRDVGKVSEAIDRAIGSGVKARLRAAGYRGH